MAQARALPNPTNRSLRTGLGARLPPSDSTVTLLHRETTVCYAYMCPYAYGCDQKSTRPAQVLMRRCMRYLPESMRLEPAMSELALDLLARRQQKGQRLTTGTKAVLERVRPNGPLRKSL